MACRYRSAAGYSALARSRGLVPGDVAIEHGIGGYRATSNLLNYGHHSRRRHGLVVPIAVYPLPAYSTAGHAELPAYFAAEQAELSRAHALFPDPSVQHVHRARTCNAHRSQMSNAQ
jgi:hypothetical protein